MASERRRGGRLLAAALALICLLAAPAAGAEPTATEKETARQLLSAGRAKRDRGDLRGALGDFKNAHDIMKVQSTGLEMGKTQVALGLLVEARDTLLEVSRMSVPPNNDTFGRARDEAKSIADSLAPKIPTLRIELQNVRPGDGTDVTLDGSPILPQSLAMKVNPGKHEVIAKRGALVLRGEATLAEGEAKTLTIDMAAGPQQQPGASAEWSVEDVHPLVWAGFGTGAVGVIIGSVFGGLSISMYSDVAARCDGTSCPPDTHDDLDQGVTFGWVSTAFFIVSGVGVTAGVIGIFLPTETAAPVRAGRVTVEPLLGPGGAGVRGRF